MRAVFSGREVDLSPDAVGASLESTVYSQESRENRRRAPATSTNPRRPTASVASTINDYLSPGLDTATPSRSYHGRVEELSTVDG